MKTIEQRMTVCRHHNGTVNKECKVGVVYDVISRRKELGDCGCMLRLPCMGDSVGSTTRGNKVEPCTSYDSTPREVVEKAEREFQRAMDCMRRNVSQCCGAEIDKTHVIPDGPHKNHGPRFCSSCHKVVFMV